MISQLLIRTSYFKIMRRSRAQIKPNIGPAVTAPSALEEQKPKEGVANAPIAASVPVITDLPSTSSEIMFPLY